MENEYCVYVHEFPDGKKYFGITKNIPERRWQNGHGYNRHLALKEAIETFGWNNITHRVLHSHLTKEEAEKLECEYIAKYNTTNNEYGYNNEVGGIKGYHLTDDHKKKIGQANSGEKNGMYGHRYTKEERKAMSENSVWRGRKHTTESKKKMSIAMKGNHNTKSGADHHGAKAISQYTIEGVFIKTYSTAVEAENITGIARSGICVCAKGKNKTAGGYIWRYADGE